MVRWCEPVLPAHATAHRATPRKKCTSIHVVVIGFALLLGALLTGRAALADPIIVTDAKGRIVELPRPAARLALASAQSVLPLALLHPDPISIVAGWNTSAIMDRRYREALLARSGKETHPVDIAGGSREISIEKVVALAPDLFIIRAGLPGEDRLTQGLESAGIPFVFLSGQNVGNRVDAVTTDLTILGRALGREPAARSYIDFYRAEFELISSRIRSLSTPRPTVLLEFVSSQTCCYAMKNPNPVADIVNMAGGRNVGGSKFTESFVDQISVEHIISLQPDVYIATTADSGNHEVGLALGPDKSVTEAITSGKMLLSRLGFSELRAVRNGRSYALWYYFQDSPLDIVGLEVLAKWLHPELFEDVDPDETLRKINKQFLAVSLTGVFWSKIGPTDGSGP